MTEPIRVLQLLASMTTGGAERLALNVAEYLDRQRFHVHTLALSDLHGSPMRAQFERLGLPVRVLGARKMYDPRVMMELMRQIREWRIQIIHTRVMNPDILGRIAGAALNIPVISTFHNIPEHYENDKFYRHWLQRVTVHVGSPQLITESETLRNMYVERWKIARQRIQAINNAVPLERFLVVKPGVPDSATPRNPIITNIGRLTEQKAQHHLLDAAKIVLQSRPDARFQIVGHGELEDNLRNHAAALGIADKVIFTGTRHDIPEILGESDMFVLSSLWEGLPVSAIEAMAAARPVVLTNVGGVRDLVVPGVNGLLVPPNDPAVLATAILELLNDPQRALQFGATAREQVRNAFSMQQFIAKHEQLYTEQMQRQRGMNRHQHSQQASTRR